MKNYIGFVNDHSGSMGGLVKAAIRDYNTNITAIKDAATREEARQEAQAQGKSPVDLGAKAPKGKRWTIG